jgi:hypothetical protein
MRSWSRADDPQLRAADGHRPGFDPEHVVTMRLSLPQAKIRQRAMARVSEQLVAKVAALPGITAAGLNSRCRSAAAPNRCDRGGTPCRRRAREGPPVFSRPAALTITARWAFNSSRLAFTDRDNAASSWSPSSMKRSSTSCFRRGPAGEALRSSHEARICLLRSSGAKLSVSYATFDTTVSRPGLYVQMYADRAASIWFTERRPSMAVVARVRSARSGRRCDPSRGQRHRS